jgi:serine/threonine protein kinase
MVEAPDEAPTTPEPPAPEVAGDVAIAPADPAASWEAERSMAEVRERLFGAPIEQTRLGAYALEERLGSGGTAVVYAARDTRLDRRVAIKLVRAHQTPEGSDSQQGRLLREAQALAQLTHPNVVTIHDVGEYAPGDLDERLGAPESGFFLVMELVDGETLARWLAAQRRSWQEVLAVFLPAAEGLVSAHAAGILHRDFKPSNVVVGADGRVRVLDLGLARLAGSPRESDPPRSLADRGSDVAAEFGTMTAEGSVMGTPAYMAPEQHEGNEVDERTDVFAFCVSLWEALAGSRPYRGSMSELARAKRAGAPVFPRAVRIPRWLRRAVERGLAPEPSSRWPDVASLARDLKRGIRRRRRRFILALASPFLAVAATLGAQELAEQRAIAACDATLAELSGVWDAPRRAQTRKTFSSSGLPYAETTSRSTIASLDSYASEWKDARRASCLSELDALPHDQRGLELCLGRRRAELDTVVDLLNASDHALVRSAVDVSARLSPIRTCITDGQTRAEVSDPGGALERLGLVVARARIYRHASKHTESLAMLDSAIAELAPLDAYGLLAEAHYLRGSLLYSLGEREPGELALRAALEAAEIGGHDRTRAMTLLNLASLVAGLGTRYDEADALLEQAAATVLRIGGDPRLEVSVLEMRGLVHVYRGNPETALPIFKAQREAAEVLDPPDPLALAGALLNEGRVYADLGELGAARALEVRALELRSSVLGEQHPANVNVLNALGVAAKMEKDYRQGAAYFSRALALLEEGAPRKTKLVMVLINLSASRLALGELEPAYADAARALRLAEDVYAPGHRLRTQALSLRTSLAIKREDPDADAYCEESIEALERADPEDATIAACLTLLERLDGPESALRAR